MDGGVDVADRAQALVGLVHGEFGGEPLAQQARAPALDVTVRARQSLRLVEPREGLPRQLREGLLPRGEVSGSLLELSFTPR